MNIQHFSRPLARFAQVLGGGDRGQEDDPLRQKGLGVRQLYSSLSKLVTLEII